MSFGRQYYTVKDGFDDSTILSKLCMGTGPSKDNTLFIKLNN